MTRDARPGDELAPPGPPNLHDLFGTLNGIGLQLEVMALAFERGDAALHDKSLAAARDAVAKLTRELEALRDRAAP